MGKPEGIVLRLNTGQIASHSQSALEYVALLLLKILTIP